MRGPLFWTAAAHVALAVACGIVLFSAATPVLGVHPALKPLKFAVSIALFLASMALLLPALDVGERARAGLAWVFAVTMVAESFAITLQALRGTTSHFNARAPLDAALTNLMLAAIAVASLAIVAVVGVALFRPLAMPGLLATAWRAGLCLLLLAPVTGFAMGARLGHSVGGRDGGPGLLLVNWSTRFGDLRVAHFFSLHALQALPLLAWLLLHERPGWLRGVLLGLAITVTTLLCFGSFRQALAGRPFLAPRAREAAPPQRDRGRH